MNITSSPLDTPKGPRAGLFFSRGGSVPLVEPQTNRTVAFFNGQNLGGQVMKKAALAVLVTITGCATVAPKPVLTPGEQAELNVAMQTPNKLEMSTEEGQAAWARVQSWIQLNSVMKIQTVSDFIVETFNLDCGRTAGTRYTAQRVPLNKDIVQIQVNAYSCWVGQEQTNINQHVFAYFVKTGKLACERNGVSACLSQ